MIALTLTLALLSAPEQSEQQALFRAGSEAYRQGRYEVAIEAFEQILRDASPPPVVFSAAQGHRLQYFVNAKLENLQRSVELYASILSRPPSGRAAVTRRSIFRCWPRRSIESARRWTSWSPRKRNRHGLS